MKIKVEVDTETLRQLVTGHIRSKFDVPINEQDIVIEVRSKQNYREKEWERGEFRAVLEKNI